jgi:tetratricopeptide (TPR) repeat protein
VRAAIAALAIAGATAALALLLADRARRPPDRAAITHRYLAVAPFKNLSEDSQSEFFAVGLTEALQTRLAGLTGIYIVDAAADVGAKLFLEGGVQRWTDRLRITYRLVDRTVGVNVGAGVVEGAIEQLFRLQDQTAEEIAKDLAAHYNLPPPPSGTAEIGARPTGDVAAYDLYLQARGYLLRYQDERSVDIAIDLFQKALDRDAEMPLALAGLGEAYWKRYETTKDSTWAAEAERTAIAALEIGASLPEPHVTLGTIYFGTGKAENAAAAFRRALDLDARSDAAYRGLAKAEEALGLADSAEATFRRAIAARPDYWAGHNDLGGFYYRHGQVEKAVDCFRRVIELTPDNARGYSNLGAMYASQNRSQEAIASYERSLALKPNFRAYSNLATLYRSLGRTEEAAAMYEKALALDDRDYRVWGSLGGTYLDIAGRRAGADSALDRAIVLAEKQRAINPNDPLLLAVLSQFHAARGQRADAQRLVARALELAPEQTDVLMHATVTYELIGDRGRAVDTLGRAIRSGYAVEALEREGALRALLADEEGQRAIREAVAARLLPGP